MQERADKIIDLILKSLREEITDEEKKELDKWLAESRAYRQVYEELSNEHSLKGKLKSFGQVDTDAWWKKISEQIDPPAQSALVRQIPRRRWKYAVAGIIVFLLGLGIYYYFFARSKPGIVKDKDNNVLIADIGPGGNKAFLMFANGDKIDLDTAQNGKIAEQGTTKVTKESDGQLKFENIVNGHESNPPISTPNNLLLATPRGGQYIVTLPDGTKAWLNAASSIRYPGTFSGSERRVEVTGEVYFEVARSSKPFIAKVFIEQNREAGEVEVLGTRFNINAYQEEDAMKTTLMEGKVKITAPPDAHTPTPVSRLLSPGQQAVVQLKNSAGRIDIIKDIDTVKAIAWRKGLISFNNTPFEDIMRQIGRWYDVSIRFEGNAPGSSLSGDVERTDSLSVVLEKLDLASGMHFRIEGKTVVVLKN